jgi:hypothetical protein
MLFLPWFQLGRLWLQAITPQTSNSDLNSSDKMTSCSPNNHYKLLIKPVSCMNESCNACREEIVLENLENFHLET